MNSSERDILRCLRVENDLCELRFFTKAIHPKFDDQAEFGLLMSSLAICRIGADLALRYLDAVIGDFPPEAAEAYRENIQYAIDNEEGP